VLQIAVEAAPLHAGDLAESTAALARAMAAQGTPTTVVMLCPPDVDPFRHGFARRLRRIFIAEKPAEVFEGDLGKGVPAWIVRPSDAPDRAGALAAAAAATVEEFHIQFSVAHAHGIEALLALDEIRRVRPTAVRVATVPDLPAGGVDPAEAIVLPGGVATDGVHCIAPGIDDTLWNPAADPALPARFGPADPRGKAQCKRALQRALGFPPRTDLPLIATLSEPDQDAALRAAADLVGPRARFASCGPDVSLRLLLSGADFFVAAAEGNAHLAVLRAMRYGAIPIVPAGGPAASPIVEHEARTGSGSGLLYDATDPSSLAEALLRAGQVQADADRLHQVRTRIMATDVSWRRPAGRYLELFTRLASE